MEKYNIIISQKKNGKPCFVAMLALLFLFCFFSCTFISPNVSIPSEDGLSVIIENFESISSSYNLVNSRTISPGTCSYNDISYYTVTGEDFDGLPLGIRNITITEDNGVYSGTINTISKNVWSLVLHAYNSNDQEMLRGYATVDTRSFDTVSFVLSTDNVNTKGSYSLNLKYANSTVFSEMVNQINISLRN